MKRISLAKFGAVLTGRPFGATTFDQLKNELGDEEVELDFTGVSSLGSSFGEEVIVPIAKRQGNSIAIRSANAPVKNCIDLIASDFNIKIDFI